MFGWAIAYKSRDRYDKAYSLMIEMIRLSELFKSTRPLVHGKASFLWAWLSQHNTKGGLESQLLVIQERIKAITKVSYCFPLLECLGAHVSSTVS